MRDYTKLEVWRRSRALAVTVFRTTHGFPQREQFSLGEQMRRASLSVPSNLAEGSGRSSDREYSRFVGYAAASLSELECQLLIAGDLELIGDSAIQSLVEEARDLRRMLSGLRRALRSN
ncbi:MAG TPA: four helix bundle protein [Acidimicrobiia bacterium]|nr:four helix bundle protein [Acidimicrobiia bacterium]